MFSFLLHVYCKNCHISNNKVLSLSLFLRVFLVSVHSCSFSFLKVFTLILRARRQMPFRITAKNVLQFNLSRKMVDSAKEKLKGKFLKNTNLFTRW